MSISIVIVEDHTVVREGLRTLLQNEDGFEVVGEAGDGREALRRVAQDSPDVLILDLMIPSLNGLEVVRQMRRDNAPTGIVVLSMHSDEAYVKEALQNGAHAYVVKSAGADELIKAVREVAAGRSYLSPPLSDAAVRSYAEKDGEKGGDEYDDLTSREREVLQLVAEGHTNAEIADLLHIGRRTVETHRASMMRKLHLANHTELIRYAIRKRILPLDDR